MLRSAVRATLSNSVFVNLLMAFVLLAGLGSMGLMVREPVADLDLQFHGLTNADLDTVFSTGNLFIGKEQAPLRDIIDALEKTYCGHIGAEIMHITPLAEKQWLQQRLEIIHTNLAYQIGTLDFLLQQGTAFLQSKPEHSLNQRNLELLPKLTPGLLTLNVLDAKGQPETTQAAQRIVRVIADDLK